MCSKIKKMAYDPGDGRCFENPYANQEIKRLPREIFRSKVIELKTKLLKELEEKGIPASKVCF